MTEPTNRCGECTMCCKIVGVTDLAKPPNTWCEHCDIGHGCRIYATRPGSCANFECFWFSNTWIADALRPDRCKIVIEGLREAKAVLAMVDPGRPDAWQSELMMSFFRFLVDKHGMAVVVMHGPGRPATHTMLPEGRTIDDLMVGLQQAGYANTARYATQRGISVQEALDEVLTMTKVGGQ